jgi:mono/diheme cytochrome c family protein
VIPGFERFAAEAPGIEAGLLLLGELNCTACHAPGASLEAQVLRKQAPILDKVGDRVRPGYLRAFLVDPRAVKPGTTMPHVLASMPAAEKEAAVEALVHFLASTGDAVETATGSRTIANGKKLYHQIGCVACHGRRDRDRNGDAPAARLAASMPLGDLASKYTIPGLAAFLQDPLKVRPSGRMPALNLVKNEANELAGYLLEDLKARPRPNLSYRYYEGSWKTLPGFATLTPAAAGTSTGFDVDVARRPNDMALVFEGFFQAPGAGEYTFHLTSDDGSTLTLDDTLVVDNDGIHDAQTVTGRIELTKGMHRLVVAVFNAGGEAELDLEFQRRGVPRQPALGSIFLTPEGPDAGADRAAARADSGPSRFRSDRALAEKGRTLFARLGCASCHALRVDGAPIASTLAAPSLAQVATKSGGCLAAGPAPSGLDYRLGESQHQALEAALKAVAGGALPAASPRQVVARTMTALNCYACHVRDGRGGVEEARQEFFTTTQKEMGDEGRIPPGLDGVGAKLQPAYLRKYLDSGVKDRPYMLTRMPRFGAANAAAAIAALAELDPIEPVAVPRFEESPRLIKSLGRFLTGGEALGCIKCHSFKGIEAEGVQAIDLTVLTRRLRRDWFHRYLVDTQAYRPGTRMPTPWPGGKSMLPQVAEGDTARQIEAVWQFLSDGADADEPYGLGREPLPLVPEKEPIVYRNFIKGAGPRAIGVGYPERVSLAFDANELRIALIWQGAFIDASRHWSARGAGFQPPLGNNVLALPAGPSLALLSNLDELWPRGPAKERGDAFRGYRTDPAGRPTFLYDIAGVHVADFPEALPGAGSKPGTLRRTLTLSGPAPPRDLWFRALAATRIEPQGEGWYRIDGEWRMHLDAELPPVLRKSEGQAELLVPIRPGGAVDARIVQEFAW